MGLRDISIKKRLLLALGMICLLFFGATITSYRQNGDLIQQAKANLEKGYPELNNA